MTSLKESEHLSLPFPVIEAATNNFTTVIGRGGFGSVYRGQLSLSGQLTTVAVKRLDTKLSHQGLREFLTEILLLSRYKHRNIVSLLAFCNQGNEKILIYEYAHRGSLDRYLCNAQNPTCQLTWENRLNICIDAARGLNYLHNHVEKHQRVIHRDIKSANILIDNNGKAMIADLGLSKLGRANGNDSFILTNACGTEGYCDPVYRRTGKLTKESDVYSFGVVLFEVLCGRLCFHKIGPKQLLLPQLALRYYRKRKLNQIIDPTLSEYMDTNSVKKFSHIAYQCLLEDRDGRPSMDMVLQELEKALKLLLFSSGDEDNNHEIESEVTLSQGNWIPICLPESWDEDVPTSYQAELRVRSDFIATGAPNSIGVDESFWEHMGLTVNNLRKKKSDYNDLLVKSFSDIKKALENNGGWFEDSYIKHWAAVVELSKEVTGWAEDASGRLVYEFVACVRIIISSVAQGLKASMATKNAEVATYALKEILDQTKASGVIDTLLSCLVTCGTSLMSGSSKFLRATCEACEAIWSLIDAFKIQSTKKNAPVFPLSSMYSHSIDRINFKGDECGPLIGKYSENIVEDSENIVEAVTQAFLRSEAVRVAIFYCLRQRLEAAWSSVVQIILRCCLHNDSVTSVLCGLSNSSVVGGSGDNTIISEVFSIISLCASFDRDPQPGDTNNLKCKVSNPSDLILHSCLFLASVAQSLDSFRRNTAVIMLTSSPETQQSRLSDMAHHYSLCDGIQDIQPHSLSAMLAFAYICSLENNESAATSIREIALPLIPPSTTLCNYLRMLTTDAQGDKTGKIMLSYWHGFRDGCVILLSFRIFWGVPLAIQDLGDITKSLIDLLGNKHSDEIGLSPLGVLWTIDSLLICLRGGSSIYRQVLLRREHVKILCDLISDVHLKLLRYWVGPGGGKSGVKGTVNHVLNLLVFPFWASMELPLPDMEPHDWEDMTIEIKTSIDQYIQILLEVGFPGQIIKCLKHLELKDTERPVVLLSGMVVHRSLVVELLSKGLLNPNLMKSLLDDSSPTQVKLKVLQIVSRVAEMDKEFYEHINGADISQQLKGYLTHEDLDMRAWTCRAIGEMCRHSSFFYSLFAQLNIISLLVDQLFNKNKECHGAAVLAISHIVKHSDLFYEDLRICITQLAKLLRSAETTNQTKKNVAVALNNLSHYSVNLSEDMISEGATKALLKVVADCSVVVLDPSRVDADTESLLYQTLSTLATMVVHRSLVVELVSKGLLNPNLVKRLFDDSSPTQVKLNVLKIVSRVAEMDQEFYEHINGADILQRLKGCLTHEDPDVRAWTCRAFGEMCRHSSYFYSLLAQHNIISLLVDLLFDKNKECHGAAVLAISYIVKHSDLFYEDLRICITQLAKLLRSAETTNQTKKNVAVALNNLSHYSVKLSEDMISEGATKALLNVVTDCSVVVLDPSRVDANTESLLYQTLSTLATMVVHRSLVVELVSKGLLNPNLVKRLFDDSSPTQVKLNVLIIVSRVAEMDQEFYEHINGADILQRLKGCLTHEDPDVRAWTCRAIAEMCSHSSYFYSLLAQHNIISLLVDLLFDKNKECHGAAVLAISRIVKHSDLFYEDLRICINQLAKLLRSPETTNQTKKSVAVALNNLSHYSVKLSEDMISEGATKALLKVVADCSVVVLDPSRVDADTESLLYQTLSTLATMVVHRSLVVELVSKGLLNPNLVKRLFDDSSPTQVKLNVLKIVSRVAEMDQEFYEHINGADILQQLKGCLTHEDPDVRGWTCRAFGKMCQHSSYFYGLLAQHNIISLLVDLLFDKNKECHGAAVIAITYIVKHSDLFYEDLRICITQLAKLLRSAETTNQTKKNIVVALNNLSHYSDKLSEDMISEGAMEALLKVVADCSVVVLDPSRVDANTESLLYQTLSTLATMVVHQSLVVELGSKGLLNPNLVKRLFDDSSPTQVKLNFLKIVSRVAEMDQESYEHINGADILQHLKGCLTHEDPDVRAWTCRAIGEMCRHSSYFYSLLAQHNIISLFVDLLLDKDKYPQRLAVLSITYIVRHSDLFYEDLRICITQLAKLLLSAETTNQTKINVAVALNNLSHYSGKLSQDMISKGAMEALLKVVADCSVVLLDPSRVDANNESLLYQVLYTLATMCKHPPCRKFINSSEVYPVIGQLRQSPVENIASYATLIFN